MTPTTTDDPFKLGAALGEHLCEHIWGLGRPIRLDGESFESVGCDDVPGFDEFAVLLRRTSDGQVFEADIDITMRPVKADAAPAQPESETAS